MQSKYQYQVTPCSDADAKIWNNTTNQFQITHCELLMNYCLGTKVILFKWFLRTKQFFGTTIENKDFLNGFSSKPHADQVFKLLNIDLITIVSTSNNFVDTFCRSAKTYTQKYKHSYYLNVCCGLYWLFIEIFPNYF